MRRQKDARLRTQIQTIRSHPDGTYGAPRIHAKLANSGIQVGRKRVGELMKDADLQGVSRLKHPYASVRRSATCPAPDLVQHNFDAPEPNRVLGADITCVAIWAGFLCLTVVADAGSCRIANQLRIELVPNTLEMAIRQCRPAIVIDHSNQGSWYTAIVFGSRSREADIRPAIGAVGFCLDNALCVGFFASPECALFDGYAFHFQGEACLVLFRYIEEWHNSHRLHSAFGYASPLH